MVEMTETPIQKLGADGRPWPSFAEAVGVWTRIALLSFGGPAGQIAVMHRILVEEKKWMDEERFLHALNFCMLLPGPEAQQLAVYAGWLMHRVLGGLVAGLLFVLPGAVAIMALSWIYAAYGGSGPISAVFYGLKAAVLAIVLQAVVRIGQKALKNSTLISLSALSFSAIFLFDIPFPIIILSMGVIGYIGGRKGVSAFCTASKSGSTSEGSAVDNTILGREISHADLTLGKSLLSIGGVLFVLWITPTILLFTLLGPDHVFSEIAFFFSKMAVVTFGGAYAVLSYVAQAAVGSFGWLQPGEMLDGLGLAETTPGPLIMVTQFVGFMGAFREPGEFSPFIAGILGGLLTTWVTFTPCFLWIFLGAPYVEKLRSNQALSSALTAITAAVVGVILNLALWFGLHVVFADVGIVEKAGMHVAVPTFSTLDPIALSLAVIALVATLRFKIGMLPLLGSAAGAGYLLSFLGALPG